METLKMSLILILSALTVGNLNGQSDSKTQAAFAATQRRADPQGHEA